MADSGPIEKKTKAAAMGGLIGGLIVWALDRYAFQNAGVPEPVEAIVEGGVPMLLAFIAAYLAKHTHRTDAEAMKA